MNAGASAGAQRALKALRTLAEFALVETGAAYARTAAAAAEADGRAAAARQRCDAGAAALRDGLSSARPNPALLVALRAAHDGETAAWRDATAGRDAAAAAAGEAHAALVEARRAERACERALRDERLLEQRRREAQDGSRLDDLWLQHRHRRTP